MRRIIALTVLIVVLSTLLNLAVALGFWRFGEGPSALTFSDFDVPPIVDLRSRDLAVWGDRRGSDWPKEPHGSRSEKYLGITFRSMVWHQEDWSDSLDVFDAIVIGEDSYSIYIVESGWPVRCLAGEYWSEWHSSSVPSVDTKPSIDTNGMLVAFGAHWPNRMIWFGMIVNELFYVLLFVALFAGWCYGRRWIRRRRGCCPQCDYDLRGAEHEVCPECGATP